VLAKPNVAKPAQQTAPPPEVTSYYYFGGRRVAMRKGSVVTWLHSDHLGSASLATDLNGNPVAGSETRYKPFGEIRFGSSGLPTDRRFTGYARERAGYVGSLDFAQARYYSPYLGRFISADTIVPRPGDPQSLNRYAYSLNSPLRYVDPDGHQSIPFPTTPFFDDLVQFAQQASQSLGPYAAPAIVAVGAVALTVGVAEAYVNASWEEPRYTSFPLPAESGHEIMTTPLAGGQTITMLGTPLDTAVNQPLVLTSPMGGGLTGMAGPMLIGGESSTAKYGRKVHEDFKEAVAAKGGNWVPSPRLVDPTTGKVLIPDALSPSGRPVELKPNTPSGIRQGKRQLKKYEEVTGKKGRLVLYPPQTEME